MNVLIIEDEALTARRLQNLLHRYDPEISVLDVLSSVADSIEWLRSPRHIQPDLIFLDIHLEDDLAFKIIDELDLTIPVIFTTAYNEYMLKAFKANSIDYLLKPVDPTELAGAIQKFRKLHPSPAPDLAALTALFRPTGAYRERFMASAGTKIFTIQVSQIAYFSFEQKATFMRTFEGQHLLVDYSLDKVMQMLDPNLFFRVNRSVILALSAIKSISALSAGRLRIDLSPAFAEELFVSTDRVTSFKQWLGK